MCETECDDLHHDSATLPVVKVLRATRPVKMVILEVDILIESVEKV